MSAYKLQAPGNYPEESTERVYTVSIILKLKNYFTQEHQPHGVCKEDAVFFFGEAGSYLVLNINCQLQALRANRPVIQNRC